MDTVISGRINLAALLASLCLLTSCSQIDDGKNAQMNKRKISGKIIYDKVILEVPKKMRKRTDMFSHQLGMNIIRNNVPKTKTIYFNGKKARQDEYRYDFGWYKSNTITITSLSSNDTIIYCKSFPHFDFWVKYLPDSKSIEEESGSPIIEELKETKIIAGYLCKKAKVTEIDNEYYVYYTESIAIDDPTGIVLNVDKINGFIMEKEEIPTEFSGNFYLITTVMNVVFDSFPDKTFEVPNGYRYFNTIDEVRAEDLRIWEEKALQEWKANPLTEEEKNYFLGHWLMTTAYDTILIEITNIGKEAVWDNKYLFSTIVLTSSNESMKEVQEEEAHLVCRALMVEEFPNYRLYDYDKEKETITFRWNELFTYYRISEKRAFSLKKEYGYSTITM